MFTEEELEELEEEEIEILEDLIDDPDIDAEIVEELEELFDEEEITEEEIIELTENEDYEELSTEARQQVVQAVQEAPVRLASKDLYPIAVLYPPDVNAFKLSFPIAIVPFVPVVVLVASP